MKKISLGTILVSSVFLASCSLSPKKQNPEELIKQTQNNFIESLQNDNVFAKKQAKIDGSLKLDLNSPFVKGNGILTYDGKLLPEQSEVNISLTGSANYQGKDLNLNLGSSFITSGNRVYIKLSQFQLQSFDPQLQMLVAMANMFLNRWVYIDIAENRYGNSKDLSLKIRKIDFKKQFEKYPLFKVNKVIKDKEYEVSLNKENIASIIYNISKEIDPNFTGTKAEILSGMKEGDIKGILDIKGDKYFAFSGNIVNGLESIPFEFRYLKDQFYLKTNDVIIDLNKNGDKFDGKINIIQSGLIFNIDGELNSKTFKINLKYNQDPVNVILGFIYNAEKLDNIDITIPKDAIELQKALGGFMGAGMMGGGLQLPSNTGK